MFGATIYAGGVFGGGSVPTSSVSPDIFVFNGYSLHRSDGTIRVRQSNHDDIGEMDYLTYNAPRIDGGGVLGQYFRKKDVTLSLSLSSTTLIGLNSLVDDLKNHTKQIEGWLEILINGSIRRVQATLTSLKFNRQYFNITFIQDVQITFSTMDPHRSEKLHTVNQNYGITSNFTDDITNFGTVNTFNTIYLIFVTSSDITAININVGGYNLLVTQAITNGDIVIIDGVNKTVTYNATPIDYTGTFPLFTVGSNPIIYTFTGTTYNVDITSIYNKKYK